MARHLHFTSLSSPAENKYGWRELTARPRMEWMWPVSVSLSPPSAPAQHFARSQIFRASRKTNQTKPAQNYFLAMH